MKNKLLLSFLVLLLTGFAFAQTIALQDVLTPNRSVYCQAVQADGKILIGGSQPYTGGNYTLARLNQDGSLDPTFNGGIEIEGIGEKFSVLRIQSDGKILAVSGATIKRYNDNGIIDNTFTLSGVSPNAISDIQVTDDQKVIMLYNNNVGQVMVSRLLSNGSVDTSFGNAGVLMYNPTEGSYDPGKILVQGGGTVIISISFTQPSLYGIVLKRISTDGNAIGSNEIPLTSLVSLLNLSNGEIMVTTKNHNQTPNTNYYYPSNNFVFSSTLVGGYYFLGNVDLMERISVNRQTDGKYLHLGITRQLVDVNNNIFVNTIKLVRLNTDGTYDNEFGNLGTYTFPAMNGLEAGVGLDLTQDGKVIVCGNKNSAANYENVKPFIAVISLPTNPPVPTMICPFKAFSAGDGPHNLKIADNNTIWAVGFNNNGQVGVDPNLSYIITTSVQVGTDTDWVSCNANGYNSFAIKSNGTLWGWGSNENHQLSEVIVTPGYTFVPQQIGTDSDWAQVKCSRYHVLALKTDGTLWAWGHNTFSGEVGIGATTDVAVPTQVGTDTWQSIDAANYYSAGIKSNGTLWVWGGDSYVRLGLGNAISTTNVPLPIGTDNSWNSISAGDASFATKTNGTLWGWGAIGVDLTDTVYTPVQIGSGSNWESASREFAINTNGTLWRYSNYTITQVGTDSDWNSVDTGGQFALAQKDNLQLYGWGYESAVSMGSSINGYSNSVPTNINCSLLDTAQFAVDNQSVTIYPNPTPDKINFSQNIQSASLFSMDGRTINTTLQNNIMDVSALPKGIYLIRGLTEDKIMFTQKVIKN